MAREFALRIFSLVWSRDSEAAWTCWVRSCLAFSVSAYVLTLRCAFLSWMATPTLYRRDPRIVPDRPTCPMRERTRAIALRCPVPAAVPGSAVFS